ncbi:macrophage mannose receptor 1-like isoform X2 [Tachypleus tridentatus]|uniref:macrophage mannose receptor 1-like isoform X2 n=1 Tax=Tachypleus tridentatus TaxID=6853 RepID=UPI003FD58A1A
MCKVTDLIPPVIDIPSDSGTCPEHLKSWLNIQGPSCFYIEQENNQMSWGEASLFCRRTGARLVTFHSLHDLLVLEPYLQPEAISLWIGLIRKHDGGYDWEDGSVVDFTYWGDGEPSNPDAQLCVEMYEHNLRWNDEVCSNRRGFICQVEKVPPEPTCETEDGRWKYFKDGDACYHVLKANLAKKYTWHDAEDYCTKEGGHLVSIHSKKENNFIQKMIQEAGSFIIKSYWIGFHALGLDGQFEWTDGSLTEFINWDNTNEKFEAEEKCVLMFPNSGTWVDHHCDLQERGAVCKVANSKLVTPAPTIAPTPLPGNCPDGWYTLGDKCYLFSEENGEEEMTWQEAREACRKKGSNHDLVSIHSTKEQMFLTSALAFSKTSVWIGLKRAKGSNRRFIWSDNSPFDFDHWAPREPNSYVDGCVEMIGAPSSAGKWNDRKCTEKAAYICQRYKDPSLPESRPPNHVDCSHLDQGYVGYRETCYKLFIEASQMKSWKKAEEFCVGQGGHLTSVTDLFDQAFLYSLLDVTIEYIWNGFHAKFDQDRFRWTDNWPVYYTKWTKGQPGATTNNNTRCVAFQETNEWTVVPCDTKLSFVCKVTDLKPPIIDIPHISGSCPKNEKSWIDIQGPYCFYFSTDRKSWIDASVFCKKRGGSLARFHSMHDLQLIQMYLTDRNLGLWIGLLESHDGGYEWETSVAADFFNWDKGEPSSPGRDHCVELRPQNLKWNDQSCSLLKNYICMTEKEDYKIVTTTTTIAPEVLTSCDENHPKWKLFQGNCYLVEDIIFWESHKKMSWHAARDFCRQNGAYLTSIHSQEENGFIKLVVDKMNEGEAGYYLRYWTGLHALGFNGILEWTDGSALEFVNWEEDNEISTDEEKCVIFNGKSGKWTLNHCNLVESFVCKRPYGNPPTSIPTINPPIVEGNCPNGWTSIKQSSKCFKFFGKQDQDKLPWTDARSACRKMTTNGDLATIGNKEEQLLLTSMLLYNPFNVWTGLSKLTSAGITSRIFGWVDNTRVSFVNWAPGSPSYYWKRCVTMIAAAVKAGKWIDSSCSENQGYVCQQYKDDPPIVLEPMEVKCPNNFTEWLDVEGHYCYYIDNKYMKQWGEASRTCLVQNSTLVSFHSEHELKIIQPYLSSTKMDLWTGLVQGSQGGFRWMDYSPVDYTNWGEGEPKALATDHCVLLRTQDMTWQTSKCTNNHGHICMVKKVNSDKQEKVKQEHSPRILASWAVVVICLCIIILLGVITSLCFYRLRKITSSTKLPLSFNNIMYTSGSDTLSYPDVSSSPVTSQAPS